MSLRCCHQMSRGLTVACVKLVQPLPGTGVILQQKIWTNRLLFFEIPILSNRYNNQLWATGPVAPRKVQRTVFIGSHQKKTSGLKFAIYTKVQNIWKKLFSCLKVILRGIRALLWVLWAHKLHLARTKAYSEIHLYCMCSPSPELEGIEECLGYFRSLL